MKCFLVLTLAAAAVLATPATKLPAEVDVKAQKQVSQASTGEPSPAAVVVPESDVEIDDTLQGKHSILFEYARSRSDTVGAPYLFTRGGSIYTKKKSTSIARQQLLDPCEQGQGVCMSGLDCSFQRGDNIGNCDGGGVCCHSK